MNEYFPIIGINIAGCFILSMLGGVIALIVEKLWKWEITKEDYKRIFLKTPLLYTAIYSVVYCFVLGTCVVFHIA